MKNSILIGVRNGLGLRFILGAMAVVTVLMLSVLEPLIKLSREFQIQEYGYHIRLMMDALLSDTFMPFVAIVAVLPFTANYVDEIKSKFARFSMLRIGYTNYLASKVVVCFILGGAVVLTGIVFTYFIGTLVFLPMEMPKTDDNNQIEELLECGFLMFLNGGFWAVLGMTMSTVMESKYIAYASPFVVYYLLVMLYERYFPDIYLIYPKQWMNPSNGWPMGILGVTIYMLEITIFLGTIFYIRGKRRLAQL